METNKEIGLVIEKVRKNKPLIHQITNYITANDCANITLALGASPAMADSIEEVSEMVSIASALVINMGTLSSTTLEAMIEAGKAANKIGVPVVLDPVGVGATSLRTKSAAKLLEEVKFAVIRGNLSEIKVLAGYEALTKGVDSNEEFDSIEEEVLETIKVGTYLAASINTVIAITGEQDLITDGNTSFLVKNGAAIMASVTGTGCMCTALIGSCCGGVYSEFKNSDEEQTPKYLMAALTAVSTMSISGELAAKRLDEKQGTGTLRMFIIDNVFNMNKETISTVGKIETIFN
ncbi:hydroxyethylthiazole kinase [Clostridium sp. DL1XJH146]